MSSDKTASVKKDPIVIINESEDERLLKKLIRPDIEKFQAFTKMLRTNAMLKQAKITHK